MEDWEMTALSASKVNHKLAVGFQIKSKSNKRDHHMDKKQIVVEDRGRYRNQ